MWAGEGQHSCITKINHLLLLEHFLKLFHQSAAQKVKKTQKVMLLTLYNATQTTKAYLTSLKNVQSAALVDSIPASLCLKEKEGFPFIFSF